MKKMYGFVALIMILASVRVLAQSRPFIGYDKVAWGSNVEQVRQAYNIGNDVALIEDKEDPNIATFMQISTSGNVTSRQFLFNKWNSNEYQLYRVIVKYRRRMNFDDHLALKQVLERTYGNTTREGHGGDETYRWVFERFSPDIEVELIADIYFYVTKGTSADIFTQEQVWYTWKKYRDSYQAYKSEQARRAEQARQAERESKVEL